MSDPKAKRERDERHILWIGANLADVKVGQNFYRWINQADRLCTVFVVKGTRYAYDYEMPAGGVFIRVGNTETGRERSISARVLPGWVRTSREGEGDR